MKKKNGFSRDSIRIISFLLFVCLALSVSTVVNMRRANRYALSLELQRQQSLSQLCESLSEISTVLKKSLFSASAKEMQELSRELAVRADCAKQSLSALDCGENGADGIYRFLSQVGEYTSAVSRGSYDPKKNAESLMALSNYSSLLSRGFGNICTEYFDGSVSFESTMSNLEQFNSAKPTLFSDSFTSMKDTLSDYPTLIYDGPYSEAQQQQHAHALVGKNEITRTEAKEIASKLINVNRRELREDTDEEGVPYLYCFSTDTKAVGITKLGGRVCYILNAGYAGEATISPATAIRRAKDFLNRLGYESMEESYYSVYDGICTVNFAAKQDEVILYGDLIKVSVALDTGLTVALDARGYLLNHRDRQLTGELLTERAAAEKLSGSLKAGRGRLALIPKEGESEALCYEFKCTLQKQDALVYINAVTGEEEDVLLLLYSDGGILTK